MGLAGLLGTVELKSRGSVCLWLFVPPESVPPMTTNGLSMKEVGRSVDQRARTDVAESNPIPGLLAGSS